MALSPGIQLPQATTLAEVAREAGVSLATASKALNGRKDVNEKTRAKVVEAAKTLGFFPNQQARSLMFGRSGSVGLLTTDLEGRFVLPIMIGAEDALGEGETVAIMANSRGNAELADRYLTALLSRRVDGIIRVGDAPEAVPPTAANIRVPVVFAYAPSQSSDDISIVGDHRGAGQIATEHLLSVGRRAIAHVGGPTDRDKPGHTAAKLRAQGTVDALAARGMHLLEDQPLFGDWSEEWGWQCVSGLLDRAVMFDGLVCANDHIARGAIDCLVFRGVRVPEDVAVIGFDDWAPIAPAARIPQSSVDMDLPLLGRTAASAVLEPGTLAPGIHSVGGRVIARQSTIGN